MLKSILVAVFFCTVITGHIDAQNTSKFRFETINSNKGLSNNGVSDVEFDDFGFLWVATADGLCRVESVNRIKVYSEDDYPALKSSNIRTLLSDSKGNLWIGTKNYGLTLYNQKEDTWKHFIHDKEDTNSIINNEILTIIEDSNGRIWIGTENGLSIYDVEKELFYNYTQSKEKDNSLKGKAILSIIEDSEGRIWLGSWGSGMYLVMHHNQDRDLNKLSFRNILPGTDDINDNNIWCIFQDPQERYWVGTFGAGLYHMKIPTDCSDLTTEQDWTAAFQSIKSLNNDIVFDISVTDIITDHNNTMWISTTNGLNRITETNINKLLESESKVLNGNGLFDYMNHSSNDPLSIPNTTINKLTVDKQGLLWIGTTSGIGKYNPNINQYKTYPLEPNYAIRLYGQNLHVTDERQAWVSDNEYYLVRYDLATGKKEKYQDIIGTNVDYGLVYSILEKENNLYLLTEENIVTIDLATYAHRAYKLSKEQSSYISDMTVRSTFLDSKNNYYMCTDNGLMVNNLSEKDFKLYIANDKDQNSLVDNSVTQVIEDSQGSIWVSTYNGLSKVISGSYTDYTFENYKHSASSPNGICNNQITSMIEVNEIIYFGLASGICSYDIKRDKFTSVTLKGENYNIVSLANIGDHTIIGTAMDGIFYLNIETGNIIINNEIGGSTNNNKYIPMAICADKDDHIYFGTINGIMELDPDLIRFNTVKPDVFVTDIKVISSEGERIYSGVSMDELELYKKDYLVSFNFAAINYIQSHKNKYAFRLKGFEEKWNYLDNNITSATYTNLDVGDYTFQVKASNNDGLWNEEGHSIAVSRVPAFTENLWFKLLAFLAAIVLILFAVKAYTHSVRARAQEMELLVSDRTQELAQKNKQVEDLLSKIQFRNTELEELVEERTINLIEANNDLKRSNSDLEQFAYVASHDLQEPLRTVGTFTSLLSRKYKDSEDEATTEYVDFIVNGVKRMSNLIQSILTYSKVGRELNIEFVDINKLVESKIKDLSKRIEDNNAEITVGELPKVKCDGPQIGMVFYNMINNGLKFNKKDIATVDIDYIQDDSEYFKFSVKDNGIGVKKEYQDKIFELFNRLHLKSEYEGTGIGLTLCDRIISKHGGSIWLESEEGVGTTFYFTIKKQLES